MDTFITVKKDSPDFQKYLENRSMNGFRAVPVDSQNINTDKEIVTFELRPSHEFDSLGVSQKWMPLLKLNKFLYFFFPIFYVVADAWAKDLVIDSTTLALSWISITALFLAVSLRSDYIDHMIGLDRILKKTATKPVSLGWISALSVKRFSFVFFTISVALGLPVAVAFPITLSAMAISTIVIFWAVLRRKQTFRDHLLGDLGWSLLVGPVLSVGFELSIRGDSQFQTFAFGCVWAAIVFYRLQVQNFEVIVEASAAKIKNGITWFGFDKGKKLILILWVTSILLFSWFNLVYSHWLYWMSVIVICGYFTFKARKTMMSLSSPVGSEMNLFVKEFHQLYVLLTALWCVSLGFSILVQFVARFTVS